MPDLSVIIVSYNTRELLRNCLLALRRNSGLALEVIVVDNASSDGSVAMVRADFPEARLLAQDQNRWYSCGNNIGLRAARGEYALLLNPDTEVAPDALRRMRDYLRANPAYAGVTAQLRYPDGAVQRTCSRIPGYRHLLLSYTILGWLLPAWRRRAQAALFYGDWDRQSDRDVAVVPGSCTMMRREDCWLDGDLLLYFPEDSLARRLGRKMRFLAAARITHHEQSSTGSFFARRFFFRDMLVYCVKHYGPGATLLLRCLSRPVLWAMWLKNRLGPSPNQSNATRSFC